MEGNELINRMREKALISCLYFQKTFKMEEIYKVYKKERSNTVIISLDTLPESQSRTRRKYIGKKASIESIFRYTNKILPPNISKREVNEEVAKFYGTEKWKEYYKIFKIVSAEQERVEEKYTLLYHLKVRLKDEIKINPNDERIYYFLLKEINGERVESYNGLCNPIICYEKIFTQKEMEINQAFAELIKERGWNHTEHDRKTAWNDKKLFLEDKLIYERKKEYLLAAGYIITQSEKWGKNG